MLRGSGGQRPIAGRLGRTLEDGGHALHGQKSRDPQRADVGIGLGQVDVVGHGLRAAQDPIPAAGPALGHVIDDPRHLLPAIAEHLASATEPSVAIRLEDAAEHAVEGRIERPADPFAVQLGAIERQPDAMRDRSVRRLQDIPFDVPHRAFEFRKKRCDGLLVVPDVRAVERARPTDGPIPIERRRAKAALEAEQPAGVIDERRRAANQRWLGRERLPHLARRVEGSDRRGPFARGCQERWPRCPEVASDINRAFEA